MADSCPKVLVPGSGPSRPLISALSSLINPPQRARLALAAIAAKTILGISAFAEYLDSTVPDAMTMTPAASSAITKRPSVTERTSAHARPTSGIESYAGV